MKPIDIATAQEVIDFSGGDSRLKNLGQMQLEGAVALHNMLADPEIGLGYLADEVGMGKTYVALGVVALMRYFNPSLRVLYICPSRNVQEKWDREYLSFIKHNVKVSQYRIRTVEGKPAAPYISCQNVTEMIKMASLGYYADFYVRKDSFSIGLDNDETEDNIHWKEKCESIRKLIPAHEWDGVVNTKADVKIQYAKALNYILPTFDLVVIDEAHNFKHDFESSDRNKVLSRVLGFCDESEYQPRVKRALLLSATPYDRDINQLRNQLALVGKPDLLPEGIKNGQKDQVCNSLKNFMVRRLNAIAINGEMHTRNMYRKEHRTGDKAEITLASDEQKLVTALVQKKVGEMMNRKDASPAYQIGMLASFESYAQATKSEAVQFDGENSEKLQKDAQDRHVVRHIVDSYKEAGLGSTLPHPKMDTVCKYLASELFENARKQIVFVRRVKSVGEIKEKLDEHYNLWIQKYIHKTLVGNKELQQVFKSIFLEYQRQSIKKDGDISEGKFRGGTEGDSEDNQPPKNDTFFAWFFRGAIPDNVPDLLVQGAEKLTTPVAVRKGLSVKNQSTSLLMELNWARFICEKEAQDLGQLVNDHGKMILDKAKLYIVGASENDYQDLYQACQLGFIDWYGENFNFVHFQSLLAYLKSGIQRKTIDSINLEDLENNLLQHTFYTELHRNGLSTTLFPLQEQVYQDLKKGECGKQRLDLLDTHCHLISLCLRTGHGIIDVYLSRLKQGSSNLNIQTRLSWLQVLMSSLKDQSNKPGFSTYQELLGMSEQLELVIKTNIPEIFDISLEKRRSFISDRLNPVAPIIGATGEVSGRSAQARKFRMPGYPLALVSTDVFQEGEDLHTFCDSVVHYGLSGSPISIEQKTGRVDRVNSMAQRRLLNYKKCNVDEDDLIQVTFPYVKESIELLQVRQLCHNVNDFIASLHELGSQSQEKQDIVEAESALRDKSEIPDQIWEFLKSPYVPDVVLEFDDTRKGMVLDQSTATKTATEHVKSLVKSYCQLDVFTHGYKLPNTNIIPLAVRLDSARSSGETLLIAECVDDLYQLSLGELKRWMMEKSWCTFHRTQAEEITKGCYRLYMNCEMLVGDKYVTQVNDISSFFDRFNTEHNPNSYQLPISKIINDHCQRAISEPILINGRPFNGSLTLVDGGDGFGLKFNFGVGALARSHTVLLYESDGHCIFMSKAVTADQLAQLGAEKDRKIIEYTWVRNRYVDVVEFLLDKDYGISGRAIHPVNSLDWDEFIFCAYVLAVEADRLEYIFNSQDLL